MKPVVGPGTGIIGIHTGGVWVAARLHAALGIDIPLGTLDVSFYRDDFEKIGLHRNVKTSDLPFDVDGRRLILVDDVLVKTARLALVAATAQVLQNGLAVLGVSAPQKM